MRPSTGCGACFEYATDLFDRSTIERLAEHFERLLEGIAAEPGRRLSELPLLGEAERHRLLVEWNDTAAAYPRDKCLHELFAAQAARTPDAVALVYEERQLTLRRAGSRGRTSWRIISPSWGWVPRWWWGCAWSARWRWSSGCWVS